LSSTSSGSYYVSYGDDYGQYPAWPRTAGSETIPRTVSLIGEEGLTHIFAWQGQAVEEVSEFERSGAAVAEPGVHTPGIAVACNGVAPHPPQSILPSTTIQSKASRCSAEQQKILIGTPGRTVVSRRRAYRPVTDWICDECSWLQRQTVSFNSKKDLRRHKSTTKAHKAPPIARCSCGKTVSRKDALAIHWKSCRKGFQVVL